MNEVAALLQDEVSEIEDALPREQGKGTPDVVFDKPRMGGARMILARLSRCLDPTSTRRLVFALMSFEPTAYCDESYQDHHVYVIAGYQASFQTWESFEYAWGDQMREPEMQGLKRFHAHDCQQRSGDFEGWSEAECQYAWRRCIEVIRKSAIFPIVTAIDLRAFDQLTPHFKQIRPPGYASPYLHAFQYHVTVMVNELISLNAGEKLAFIFDQNKEFKDRAKGLFDALMQQDPVALPFISHLGSITFGAWQDYPELQAADILAFEGFHYFRDVKFTADPKPVRWQWSLLQEGGGAVRGLDYDALESNIDEAIAGFSEFLGPEEKARYDKFDDSQKETIRREIHTTIREVN